MVYRDSSQPNDLIALEKKHWAPLIKGASAESNVGSKVVIPEVLAEIEKVENGKGSSVYLIIKVAFPS